MTDAEIRSFWPGASKVRYFNAASQALLPVPVADAVRRTLDRWVAGGIHSWPEDMREVETARSRLARLVGADSADVAFTGSTAESVARVAHGLDLREGDEVVLSDLEYPANVYPWTTGGARLRLVPSAGGRVDPERLVDAIGPRTRVLALSMVQFSSGFRSDLTPLGEVCRKRGVLFFVDGIQGLGVFPVDMRAMGIGALAGEGRKWLAAPPGTGFLGVAPEWIARIRPSGSGAMSVTPALGMLGWVPRVGREGDLDLGPVYREGAGRYESGYHNVAGLAGLGAALALHEAIGSDTVRSRVEARVGEIVTGLQARDFTVFGPRSGEERSGIVAFEVPGDPELWRRELAGEGISLGVREGRLRAAPHVYNDRRDVEVLLESLDRLRAARV